MRTIQTILVLAMAAGACGGDDSGGSADARVPDAAVPDGGMPDADPVGMTCDPIAQDCPAELRCSVTFDLGGPTCQAPGGTDGVDDACTRPTNMAGIDTCEGSLYCANFGVTSGRVCRDLCTAAAPCADSGRACFEMVSSGIGVCLPACTPLSTGECATGTECFMGHDPAGPAIGYCEAPGAGVRGDTCASNQDCVAGLTCVNRITGETTCEVSCETTGNTPCATGVTCLPLTNEPGYGYCDPA